MTSLEELATNRGEAEPSLPGLATNRGAAGPIRAGVAARDRPGLAERATRLQALAMTVGQLPGPEEVEGPVVPQVRTFDQPITRLAGRPGAVPRCAGSRPIGPLRSRPGTDLLPRGPLRWRTGPPRAIERRVPGRPRACTGAERGGRP